MLWNECIKEIKSVPVHKVEINVKVDVQKCLTDFEPLRSSSSKVIEKLQSNPLGSTGLDLQLKVIEVHVKGKRK